MSDYNKRAAYEQKTRSDIFFTKTSNDREQWVNPNHRNISTLNFGNDSHESFKVKKSQPERYDPGQHFAKETAFHRKLKEFCATDNLEKHENLSKSVANTTGVWSREAKESNADKLNEYADPNLTARERKVLQYNPKSVTKENVKEVLQKPEDDGMNQRYPAKNHKEHKINDLKSNIFSDPERANLNRSVCFNENHGLNLDPPKVKPKIIVPLNKWQANIDWKDAKNELIFYKENTDHDKNLTPYQRNLIAMTDHFDTGMKVDHSNLPERKEVIVDDPKGEVINAFREHEQDESKIKKGMELSSAIQGKTFYEKNLRLKQQQQRPVSSYQVNNIKDFENLNVKEVESMFKQKG
jgi:hypothetical protein